MTPLSEAELRRSFVNCSRGEASRLPLPPGLDEMPWPRLDFLGWVDPKAPQHAYAVLEHGDRPLGIRLRRNLGGASTRARMCSLCCTVHPRGGVTLMTAARAGAAGRRGDTVGLEACHDLRCSGYVRGWAPKPVVSLLEETTTVEDQARRLTENLGTFARRVVR